MKRGIVMSIHDKHAVVMTESGQFLRAPLQGSPQIGEEIIFEEEIARSRRSRWNRNLYRYAGAAAILCILAVSGLAYVLKAQNPVVAYLTMDINPSVEIGVDGGEKVRELRALNEDGAKVIEGIAYKGINVEIVASAILEKARKSHYLDASHNDIIITSILIDGEKRPGLQFESLLTGKLDQNLQQWLQDNASAVQDVSITTLSVPEDIRVAAAANGVSSGKMAVYLMAKNEGYELELKQLKEESIDEWTEPIGGVKKIVKANDEAKMKKKLQKLLENEQKEKKQKEQARKEKEQDSKGNEGIATAKPSATAKPHRHQGKRDHDDRDDDDDDRDDDRNHNRGEARNDDRGDDNRKENNKKSTRDNKDRDDDDDDDSDDRNRDKKGGKEQRGKDRRDDNRREGRDRD